MNAAKYLETLRLIVITILYFYPIIILTIIIIVLAVRLVNKIAGKKTEPERKQKPKESRPTKRYQAKKFLSDTELRAYEVLKQYSNYNFLYVFPKVSLTSILKPTKETGFEFDQKQISNRLVDFIIFDQSFKVRTIIELNNASMNRDIVKEEILKEMGYKVIHTDYITQETLKQI